VYDDFVVSDIMVEKKSTKAVMQAVDRLFDHVPAFVDVFDEETFYMFAGVFVGLTCIAAFTASRYIKIKHRD